MKDVVFRTTWLYYILYCFVVNEQQMSKAAHLTKGNSFFGPGVVGAGFISRQLWTFWWFDKHVNVFSIATTLIVEQ